MRATAEILRSAWDPPDRAPQPPVRAAAGHVGGSRLPQRPLGPTLRANPFPEVTDLFCRLPLPTLFYQLEAAHLGDLMRLCVRPRVRISLSPGFSRAVGSAPDTSKIKVLCQLCHPIAGQSDSRVTWCCQKEKRTLPGAPADVSGFACVATHYPRLGSGILTRFPFDRRGGRKKWNARLPNGVSLSLRID